MAPLRDGLSGIAATIIGTGHYVLGPAVAEFERQFAAYCGVGHCVGLANGTDALELALKAIGTTSGDRVAVCANAAMYGTTAVLACGAEPLFVDVQDTDGCMDPAALERALGSGPAIRAVIVTHLYGRLAPVDAIATIARRVGAKVVEDCAQAHGSRTRDCRMAGAIGDIASFSFYPTKNLGALGDGGAVTCDDDELARRVRQLRQYGWGDKYRNDLPGGRNSRLDEMQAAMLSLMLPLLDGWNARRREIVARLSGGISNARIRVPEASGEDFVGHLYVVRTAHRDALREHLADAGIQTDVHFPIPDHRQPCHAGRYDDVQLPLTERLASEVLTLPCFPELTDAEADRIIDACNSF